MNNDILKKVIFDQEALVEEKLENDNIISRLGFDKCKKALTSPNLLLLSGLRRAGKSIFGHLLLKGSKYASINFDDERLVSFKTEDFNSLLETFYSIYGDFDYLLFDEIQNIKGWELFVNRLREKYKVIITGSNANLLSSDLATHLTGRYSDYVLFPMNFAEYLDYQKFDYKDSKKTTKYSGELSKHLNEYLIDGGIFDRYKFGQEFVRNLITSIITKDIVVRYNLQFAKELEELSVLLINNITSKVSANKIAKHLGIKSSNTIREYINYLEKSFLIFTLNKFSYKLTEQQSSFKKVYCIDNGMASSIRFAFSEDAGRYLENAVAVELKRLSYLKNYEMFYWDDYKNECDFIIKQGAKIVKAYQVCSNLDESNMKRETQGLISAMKSLSIKDGAIITLSQDKTIEMEGFKIKVMPASELMIEC
ncbi:MAG: ATP-binding protein [Myxococcales bacterium]|nr:ATP-binding protein [Myxococcales bacterium]